jgi:hydrogenase/urease accessory protein HupE
MNCFRRAICVCALLLLPALASAHEMSIAEMELREVSRGDFLWQWTATSDKRSANGDLKPLWPAGCTADDNRVSCGDKGLRGTLAVDGVGNRYSAVIVKTFWLDGGVRVYTLSSSQPTVQLYGTADDRRGMGEIASAYTVLGVQHILSGYDHLAFVIALLFLVGFNRRLLYTVTAFTLAHSLTLGMSATGWLTLRSPPVEATIALSIMLVAAEALHARPTLSRRWPALVAFLFGLVHGLGFAGALKEIGLPQNHLLVALLTFNVGVEVGQLLVVGAAYLLFRSLVHRPAFLLARVPALYTIGTLAAFWSIGRIVKILV